MPSQIAAKVEKEARAFDRELNQDEADDGFSSDDFPLFKDASESTITGDTEHKMQMGVKYLEEKYDDVGRKYYSEPSAVEEDKKPQLDWWQRYALCETRHYYPEGDIKCTRLHVNPQPLKELLEDAIGNYPNEPIDAQNDVEITLPAKCLFHYRSKLMSEGKTRFKHDAESLGQPRAYRVTNASYNDNAEQPSLVLSGEYVDFDGERFGAREATPSRTSCSWISSSTRSLRSSDTRTASTSWSWTRSPRGACRPWCRTMPRNASRAESPSTTS